MGFQTIVSISNDFWHEIAKNPDKLVQAISIGMNDGAGEVGPIAEALNARETNDNMRRYAHELRYRTAPQGLTVHRSQHYDTAQVVVNAYGYHATAAHEIPTAISIGWLDIDETGYREDRALEVAKELENLARRIREAIRKDAKGKT